jgi:magnesium chelatase family protein
LNLLIALSLLMDSPHVAVDRPGNHALIGELALTGESWPVKGIHSMALQAVLQGPDGLLVPTSYGSEAVVVDGLNVSPVDSWPTRRAYFPVMSR